MDAHRCWLRRRGEQGLTTLEWLLVVAAIAGLAALAVVLVQNVVGGTAEQVASHSARQQAAELAANVLQDRWRSEVPADAADAQRINEAYGRRCRQLGIIYSDIELTVRSKGGDIVSGVLGWDPGKLPTCSL